MAAPLLIARVALAAVFAVAALTKLADRAGARQAVIDFGAPSVLAGPLAVLLPLAELAIAIALLPGGSARWGAVAAMALLLLFSAAMIRSIARGEAPDCHCFGQLHSEPAGWRAVMRNALLVAVAGFVVLAGWHAAGPSAVAWIGRLSASGEVAFIGGVALAVLAAAGGAFMLALLRQQGRLLLRVDALEARLEGAGVAGAPPPAQPEFGLPIGSPAPDFDLAGLYGETVTLGSLIAAEKPLALLFTDPGCGPCSALMPRVAAWQADHSAELTIAVISRGSIDENRPKAREHGVGSVWLDPDLSVYNAYQVPGTPSAVLIDTTGRIAGPTHAGADAIASLMAQATGRAVGVVQVAAQSERQAVAPAPPPPPPELPIGSQAPVVELSDLMGKPTPLTAADHNTLVLFWNPSCGFCQQMLDDLRGWESDPPAGAPRLVLVSTGSVEDNKAMGLRAPILLEPGFTTGMKFGTTGTPSGVVVDSHGLIASELAIGAPGVMALAMRPSDPRGT